MSGPSGGGAGSSASASAGAAVFDRVTVRSGDGSTRGLTRTQFMALPLAERVEAILHGKPQFYSGDQLVPARAALKSLY